MAEFNEKTALEIIEKNNLSPKTIATWRFNKRIPDKYFPKSNVIPPQEVERILTILKSEKINRTTLALNTKLPRSYFYKILNGVQKIDDQKALEIKKQLAYIRLDVSKLISILEQSRTDLVKEIEFMDILRKNTFYEKYALGEAPAKRITSYRKKHLTVFPFDDKEEMLKNLIVFRIELSI